MEKESNEILTMIELMEICLDILCHWNEKKNLEHKLSRELDTNCDVSCGCDWIII